MEQAYLAQAHGRTIEGTWTQSYVPLSEPDLFYRLKTMGRGGVLYGGRYMVLRITSDIVSETAINGTPRRETLPRGPGETYCGFIILFSVEEVAPVGIIHDGYIQIFRVACTSALSARLLARADAGNLGLLGSGGQAWAHLIAMNAVFPLRRVRLFSPNPEHRRSFAERAAQEFGIHVTPVESARAAVESADLVVAATNTSSSIVDGSWLAPCAHVISIVSGDHKTQRRELDDEIMRRASVVLVHSKETARSMNQGDLSGPVAAGILTWDCIHDLSELVAGAIPGRTSLDQITVFKNNVGLGMQFAAVAPHIYERARAAGIGRELPIEWFLEKLKA